jgi:ABC-type nitrate/sulfonate/bicarbonate transport system substrate-binding protein
MRSMPRVTWDGLFGLFLLLRSVFAGANSRGLPQSRLDGAAELSRREQGFYTDEGLEAKFARARSNVLVAALVSGGLDYITSVATSIGGIMGGAPAKIVAGVTRNNPDFLMAWPWDGCRSMGTSQSVPTT